MKNKLIALALITATALSLAPTPARADDRGLAIVGGFLGGLIVASAINDSHHYAYADCNTAVVVERDPYCGARYDAGCWREVSVNVWVPGCWIEERGYYGRPCRRYVGAHYEVRNNRVWVANVRHDRHDRRDNDSRRDLESHRDYRR
jgi:hypothetical protein